MDNSNQAIAERRASFYEQVQRNLNAPGQREALQTVYEWAKSYPELVPYKDQITNILERERVPVRLTGPSGSHWDCGMGIHCKSEITTGHHGTKFDAKKCIKQYDPPEA